MDGFRIPLAARRISRTVVISTALVAAAALAGSSGVLADDSQAIDARVKQLEDAVKQQEKLISQQQQQLLKQQLELQSLGGVDLDNVRGAVAPEDAGTTQPGSGDTSPSSPATQPVGVPPAEEDKSRPPKVTVLSDQGGVLTPAGKLVLEPSIEYSHSSTNRLTFRGVELQDTVLIGVIDASAASRDLISPALTARSGVTDRLEVEAKIPYVHRSDRVTFTIPRVNQPDIQETSNLTGDDLGDIEVAGHYQITGEPPFVVGNLRFKTTTGKGPFDVKRDQFGVEQELSTGSGFYGVEPSVTVIYPSDPAVLFANVGYQWNVADSVNKNIGGSIIGNVDPGDAIEATVGMGFSVNDRLSFDLGYKHDYIMETTTKVTDAQTGAKRTDKSDTLTVGSLLFGLGYRLTDSVNLNMDFEFGVTGDAPDMSATLRVPVLFDMN